MSWNVLHSLKGLNNEFEIIRLLSAFGVAAFIVGTHTYIGYDVFWMKRPFNVTEYCLAFPGGLAAVIAAAAKAVQMKDQGVANAKITAQTGAIPTPALDGARVPPGDSPPVGQS